MTNLDKVLTVFRGITARHASLATRHVHADKYVEHDPYVGDGVAGLRRYVEQIGSEEHRLDVIRAFEDGDHVVVQADGQVRGDGTFFDVFRFEDGLIVEHWGFSAPSGPPNLSGHTQVDGPVAPVRLDETAANRAFVRDYYERFHIGGRHDLADRFFAGSPMIRHEPGVADGVDAFLRDLAVLTKDRTIDQIRLLFGQGDLFFLAALGTHQGKPCAYVDLYRVEADRIMEHWGFPEAIPPPDMRRNRNEML